MKFSNACLLRTAITSSVVLSVLGHARLVDPEGPKRMINPCSGECAVDLQPEQRQDARQLYVLLYVMTMLIEQ